MTTKMWMGWVATGLAWLALTGVGRGANPEDFTVPSVTSAGSFSLAEARGKWVAIHFLLKTECPICLRHTREFQSKGSALTNLVQIFLKPDSVEEIRAWSAKLAVADLERFPIYRDEGAKLAKAFGVPDGYAFHGQTVHYPALVLIGPDGKEAYRYVGKSNTDRASFETVKTKVTEVK